MKPFYISCYILQKWKLISHVFDNWFYTETVSRGVWNHQPTFSINSKFVVINNMLSHNVQNFGNIKNTLQKNIFWNRTPPSAKKRVYISFNCWSSFSSMYLIMNGRNDKRISHIISNCFCCQTSNYSREGVGK